MVIGLLYMSRSPSRIGCSSQGCSRGHYCNALLCVIHIGYQCCRSRSGAGYGSGSFYHLASSKNSKKCLNSYCLWLLWLFFIFDKGCYAAFWRKIAGNIYCSLLGCAKKTENASTNLLGVEYFENGGMDPGFFSIYPSSLQYLPEDYVNCWVASAPLPCWPAS